MTRITHQRNKANLVRTDHKKKGKPDRYLKKPKFDSLASQLVTKYAQLQYYQNLHSTTKQKVVVTDS